MPRARGATKGEMVSASRETQSSTKTKGTSTSPAISETGVAMPK